MGIQKWQTIGNGFEQKSGLEKGNIDCRTMRKKKKGREAKRSLSIEAAKDGLLVSLVAEDQDRRQPRSRMRLSLLHPGPRPPFTFNFAPITPITIPGVLTTLVPVQNGFRPRSREIHSQETRLKNRGLRTDLKQFFRI